jgi:hypothetical protein
MAGEIIIPDDRTTKQPAVARCYNAKCAVKGKPFEFVTEGDVHCPKCGATQAPVIFLLVLTHFLVRDPAGLIPGHGFNYRVACDPLREHLATETNMEAGSDQLIAVNCPGCLKVSHEQNLAPVQGGIVTG